MKQNENNLTYIEGKGYEGVVYYYENEKTRMKYVGCSPREKERRTSWRNWGNAYGGTKIANARKESHPEDWSYTVIEKLYSDNLGELEQLLEEREAYYITLYDTMNKGYNGNLGGTGHKGAELSEETKRKISENHRRYQSAETRKKLSESLTGRKIKESTRKKISEANKGKVRTEEMKAAQSERLKGTTPLAAKEGAEKWREENGGGYWKGKTMSEEARAKMKKYQQNRGKAVLCHTPEGETLYFNTYLDAHNSTGDNVGAVANNARHGSEKYKTRNGYWYEPTEKRKEEM